MLPKLTEMERNRIMFTIYVFMRNLWQIHLKDSHVKFTGKNKVSNTTWAKLRGLISKTVFSKLKWKIFLFSIRQADKQVSKHLASSFPFSDFYILSSLLGCYFSGTSCTFHFGQMFNGFLTSTFDFYWSLALQFSCIMVRLSEGRFLFAVASD